MIVLSSNFKKYLYWAVTAYLFFILLLFVFQREIIFEPEDNYYTPAYFNLEDVQIKQIITFDYHMLDAWYFRSNVTEAPLIIFFHGNSGDISDRLDVGEAIRAQGIDVLMPIYRGFGGMLGRPTKENLYKDARQWVEYVKDNYPNRDIILHGRSLGSAVASKMAGEFEVKALILEVPFTSISAVAQKRYPIVPVKLLTLDNFDNQKNLLDVHEPTFFIAAGRDRVVPPEHAFELYKDFFGKKRYHIFPGGQHTDLYDYGLATYIKKFLKEVLFKPN